uniref:Ribosomal eL28/Mak16 domain-containing protein n=1 Tax=Hemiselmis tepida TaxID=464990 RepID=A0A7S0VWZ0_9CRYP|mmetsp:Transcript_31034/g.78621  ORF Transcript_31034/g.78621 Transcript_31034/m.78621 type:complete len:140 (+) Transcript_31034:1342-1761(+)
MNSENNDLVWDIIGENQFCCFKKKTIVKNFCKHEFNITGLCSRQSCPLANSKYATIIQQEGIFFLVQKDEKNLNFPNKIWKKIALSRNFGKAIQEINLNLAFWPKFFLYFAKLKLTRLTQIFLRFRINELKKNKRIFSP